MPIPKGERMTVSDSGRTSNDITLEGGAALRVSNILDFLAESPSTPELIAGEARSRARRLVGAMPVPAHHREAGQRPPVEPVVLDRLSVTGVAGLLELAAGMPSTPPDIADDALGWADELWALLSAHA